MKIGRADGHASIPESLLETSVPGKIFFRLQRRQRLTRIWVEAKNLVLTAWRTESGRDTRVQRRVRLVNLVTARDPICPNVAELVEVIDSSAGDKNHIVNRR